MDGPFTFSQPCAAIIGPMGTKEVLIAVGLVGAAATTAWRTPPTSSMSAEEAKRIERSVYYAGCNEVRAAGKDPLYAGQPGYRIGMDGDRDGIACEPHRKR